jgi:uncharacterized protein (DUF433 family)
MKATSNSQPSGKISQQLNSNFEKGERQMPYIDWSQCPVVERDPERCNGAVTFKGKRSTLSSVFANIGSEGIEGIVREYHIPREQIEEVLDFLAESCEPEQQQ